MDFNANDFEALKNEFEELKKLVTRFVENQNDGSQKPIPNVQPMRNMHPDPKLSAKMEELCELTEKENRTGSITYLGVFASGGRQSNWISNEVNTDGLLALVDDNRAAMVLQCIGSGDKLKLLLALLRKPMSVSTLVEECGFNTTGQVYHHLRPLIAADIVCEDERAEKGVYAIIPHRVQGIIMMLAGISDLIDSKFTQGVWGNATD